MGTSNWQNISWCVQAIMQIEPRRVLDIGVGFGRWGMILREFGEVWFDRVTPEDWQIHIEGIEAFPKNIADYHERFYDKLHIGDASEVLATLSGDWDLVILGDVLEHFYKGEGERILDHCLETSKYVMVNLPIGDDWPQEDKYENPYEEHKAVWEMEDFAARPVVATRHFLDFDARPFSGIVLSREDPRNLREGLFGSPLQGEVQLQGEAQEGERIAAAPAPANKTPPAPALIRSVEEKLGAVDAIRSSRSWRLLNRLRKNPIVWRGATLAAGDRGEQVHIRNLGADDGTEAELRVLRVESDFEPVLWDFLKLSSGWEQHASAQGAFGEMLATTEVDARGQWFAYGGQPTIHFQAHPKGGTCEVKVGSKPYRLDLRSRHESKAIFDCATGELRVQGVPEPARTSLARPVRTELAGEDRELVRRLSATDESTLAVCVPDWTGVANSTRILFDDIRFLPAHLDREARELFLTLVEQATPANLVLSGGAIEHLHLCREIKERSPDTKIKLLWHGSFLQAHEDYAWQGLRMSFDLARRDVIHTLGFVKQGMDDTVRDMGLRAALVLNYVPVVPDAPSAPAEGGPHLGMWISNEGWRKLPYAMAAATRRVPGAILHYAGRRKRLAEFCRLIELKAHKHSDGILPANELASWMRRMHLNLYVTLSECTPMLPLESLSVGTPCLVGPNSHLFRDHADLHEWLVVPVPDSSACIFDHASRALQERNKIVDAYKGWARSYNERARGSVREFLEL